MAGEGRAALRSGRPQPLSNRSGCEPEHARRSRAAAPGGGVPTLRSAGGDADGSRHAVVEYLLDLGRHEAIAMADTAGDSTRSEERRVWKPGCLPAVAR